MEHHAKRPWPDIQTVQKDQEDRLFMGCPESNLQDTMLPLALQQRNTGQWLI